MPSIEQASSGMRRRSTRQAAAALMARSGAGSGSLSVQEHESSSRSRRKRRESVEDGDSACTCQQSDKTFPAGLVDASPMDAGRRRSARTRNPSHRRAITAADEGSDRGQQEVVRVGKGKGRLADYQIRLSGGASSGDGEEAASSADSALVARPRKRSSRHRDPEESLIYDNHASSSTSKAIHRVLPYLASSSSLPWAIGANDDAPRHALAFTFASDSDIDHDRRIAAAPPVDAIPLLAPFLFDNTDGDELHPIGSTIRRASSLPSRLPSRSPTGTLSSLGDADSDIDITQSQIDNWLLSPAADSTLIPQSPKYESTTSTSNSATSSSSTSSQGGRNNNTNTTSQSPPTSPTSSHAECSTSSSCYQGSSSHTQTQRSGSKRSSPSMMLDATRLKKRKLSHRIRSFLLLRPPGLPYPGTDGAADIAHITRAPAWLKNATSQMSRESRMAPHEWYWSGDEIDTDVWTLSQLEKRFKEQLKVNADQEALEKEERESLSDASLMMMEEHSIPSRLYRGGGRNSEIIPITLETSTSSTSATKAASSPVKRNHTKRLRQVSAPPVMEADPEKVANALISPPQHGALPNHPNNRSSLSEASSSSNNALALPPEVLKSQLLAVLRSRLPEGSKNGDAPLRMKKFVVWNAWIRRANIAKTRPRFRRRSTSPEGTSLKAASSIARASREARPVSPPSSQVVIPALHEDMSIDLGRAEEDTHQDDHFDPYGMTNSLEDDDRHYSLININQDEKPGVFTSTSASDSDMSSSALGLMLHDETASTARRFSRAFADDLEAKEDNDDMVQSRMNTLSGPFMAPSAKSHTEGDHDRHGERSSLDSHLGLFSPSPIHPSYSTTATSPFMDTNYSYSGQSPEGEKGEMTLQDVDRHRDEDLRPISPLRARLEKKTSTATPPSCSANLDSTEHTTEEASIIPFWFDQDNIAFDNDEGHDEGDDSARYTSQYNEDADKGSHHDQHTFRIKMPEHDQASPSLSPSDRREMASYTSSKGEDQKVPNKWSDEHSVRGISA